MSKIKNKNLQGEGIIKKYLITIVLFFALAFSGCETVENVINNNNIIAKTAIQYGTLEYIDDSEENYAMVVNYTEKLRGYIQGDEYTALDLLFAKIDADISNSDLEPAQKLIVKNIIQSTKSYAEAKLGERGLNLSEYGSTALILIDWIEEAAELSQNGVTASQVAEMLE